jgi:hypothetical protein
VTVNWAAKQELREFTLKNLENKAIPNRDLVRMLAELREGEEQLSGPSDSKLMAELGLTAAQRSNPNGVGTVPAARNSNQRPGQRNPTRDPVGELANG